MEISLLALPQGMVKDTDLSASTKSLGHLQPKVGEVLTMRAFFFPSYFLKNKSSKFL